MTPTMNAVTISPLFQMLIAQEVCDQVHLEAGQQIQAIANKGRIKLIQLQTQNPLYGFLKGIVTQKFSA